MKVEEHTLLGSKITKIRMKNNELSPQTDVISHISPRASYASKLLLSFGSPSSEPFVWGISRSSSSSASTATSGFGKWNSLGVTREIFTRDGPLNNGSEGGGVVMIEPTRVFVEPAVSLSRENVTVVSSGMERSPIWMIT